MNLSDIREKIGNSGLRITPQRLAVLEAVIKLNNHPTADKIIKYVNATHPNIAVGTIYNILDTFMKSKLIDRIETDKDVMRYDATKEKHHHLYCSESNRIEDYFDDKLCSVLEKEYSEI